MIDSKGKKKRGFLISFGSGLLPRVDYNETLSIIQATLLAETLWQWRGSLTGTLLDAGCGRKPYSIIYEDYVDKAIGVDVVATPHSLDAVDMVASVEQLPFEDDSFDTVLCTEVLEHVENVEAAWSEIRRVLRLGGHLIVTVPFIYPEHEAPQDYRRFTFNGLVSLGRRHGFEVERVAARGGPIPLLFVLIWNMMMLRLVSAWARRFLRLDPVKFRWFRWCWALPQWLFLLLYLPGWRKRLAKQRLTNLERWMSLGYAAVLIKIPPGSGVRMEDQEEGISPDGGLVAVAAH